jgi:hypothetical protein
MVFYMQRAEQPRSKIHTVPKRMTKRYTIGGMRIFYGPTQRHGQLFHVLQLPDSSSIMLPLPFCVEDTTGMIASKTALARAMEVVPYGQAEDAQPVDAGEPDTDDASAEDAAVSDDEDDPTDDDIDDVDDDDDDDDVDDDEDSNESVMSDDDSSTILDEDDDDGDNDDDDDDDDDGDGDDASD